MEQQAVSRSVLQLALERVVPRYTLHGRTRIGSLELCEHENAGKGSLPRGALTSNRKTAMKENVHQECLQETKRQCKSCEDLWHLLTSLEVVCEEAHLNIWSFRQTATGEVSSHWN